jgi:hypothetical protein
MPILALLPVPESVGPAAAAPCTGRGATSPWMTAFPIAVYEMDPAKSGGSAALEHMREKAGAAEARQPTVITRDSESSRRSAHSELRLAISEVRVRLAEMRLHPP